MIGPRQSQSPAILATIMLLAATEPAFAHRLELILRVQAEHVKVETFFSDNTPARQARVQLLDNAGNVLGEGLADGAGRLTFPRPQPGKYRIVADAGDGHRATKDLWIRDSTTTTTEGGSREELTSVPWLKVLIGIGVIIGFFAAALVARKRSKAASSLE